jgi:hypothetical protein
MTAVSERLNQISLSKDKSDLRCDRRTNFQTRGLSVQYNVHSLFFCTWNFYCLIQLHFRHEFLIFEIKDTRTGNCKI